ncbi:MAG: hypothetical protein Q7U57_02190 [Methylovulum sp.]|nr:hypothetical protein [Methylovulum sp.]
MTTQHSGIQFKETMAGGFALGVDTPSEGLNQGNRLGTPLAIHVTVSIDDVGRFIDEPEHPGQLSGSIDFSPMGIGIIADSGVFNLFSPTDDPKLKLMVYELGFEHGGEAFYLAGKKEVRDDPGFDLWTDTTTLFTQLYKGSDKSGQLVGAGILTLGVTDLIKLVSTMTVTHADSAADKLKTISQFGGFFLGELWETYGIHINK